MTESLYFYVTHKTILPLSSKLKKNSTLNSTLNDTIIAVPQCIGITVPTPTDNHNAHQKPDGKFEEFRKHPQMVRDGLHGTRENCAGILYLSN